MKRHLIRIIVLAGLYATLASASNYRPAEVKAAILFHLSSYLHRETDGSPLNRYCTISDGVVENALETLLASRSKTLHRTTLATLESAPDQMTESQPCDILFTGEQTLSPSFVQNNDLLVIVGKGQEIDLTTERGKVVMYVSLSALASKGIDVSSKLLRVARVREE